MMLDILNNSAAKSGLLAAKAPMVFARNFTNKLFGQMARERYGTHAGIRSRT